MEMQYRQGTFWRTPVLFQEKEMLSLFLDSGYPNAHNPRCPIPSALNAPELVSSLFWQIFGFFALAVSGLGG